MSDNNDLKKEDLRKSKANIRSEVEEIRSDFDNVVEQSKDEFEKMKTDVSTGVEEIKTGFDDLVGEFKAYFGTNTKQQGVEQQNDESGQSKADVNTESSNEKLNASIGAGTEPAQGQLGSFKTSNGITVDFKYNDNGSVFSADVRGTLPEKNDLLIDDFRKNVTDVWNNLGKSGYLQLNINYVQSTADQLHLNNEILKGMEKAGQGSTPEARYLRIKINTMVSKLENKYGNIIKNL
ncbi:MAG: hypothetical protein HOE19_03750 [Candidatus Komeilibacteria bacterium]|jgi:ElaB/YqjD/DUF883 family membrane-anchored ribosome-binding protein|nr:hypothetical protein [Candidatus Komeilibacteria bacterium]MBT4447791.1 hypothetical protein [Candidatus Komeilibacteria bacterium]